MLKRNKSLTVREFGVFKITWSIRYLQVVVGIILERQNVLNDGQIVYTYCTIESR